MLVIAILNLFNRQVKERTYAVIINGKTPIAQLWNKTHNPHHFVHLVLYQQRALHSAKSPRERTRSKITNYGTNENESVLLIMLFVVAVHAITAPQHSTVTM